ncbi:MAG: hypothetical protein GWN67_01445 [Phycisphaerae bacterium]|nr:hypothetical protein [Phycisphaerae bacterium]NIR66661.1 hypothetical protein [candidate division Zixibacteria bacterium]NIP50622.1 hypothetical protein [Phycisphaerae bacterium]NIS49758.1 hypothetical protein [Phycisphaerae bacterium]NIU07510.1 hypothetical protein [Phycisphaerae bacterium]
MADTNREIQELLVDYAGALRDGCVPSFLKSLEREEAKRIASSRQFQDAADVTRILNGVAFADKAVTPNVGLFISRVDARISSRTKRSRASSRGKRSTGARSIDQIEKRT